MIETLARGTPVVALRNGSVAEIIDDGVTEAVCDRVAELVRKLREFDRYDRRRCREAAELRFSIHRMVADHFDLYVSLKCRRDASTLRRNMTLVSKGGHMLSVDLDPFPHAVVDRMWDASLLRDVLAEFPDENDPRWTRYSYVRKGRRRHGSLLARTGSCPAAEGSSER